MRYDTVLLDPTADHVHSALSYICYMINSDHPSHTVTVPSILEVARTDSGRIETNGGGIPKSHGYEAHTSRLGVAWWTDPRGTKHVRVCGDRIGVRSTEVESVFGQYAQGKSDFWCVYPGSAEIKKIGKKGVLILTCKCGKTGDIKQLEWDGNCCGACRAAARYEEETGFRQYQPKPK